MTHLNELISLCRHPKIQERRGKWQVGDRFYCEHCKGGIRLLVGLISPEYLCCPELDHLQCDCIWIPPLSNPLNPERSLLGMLEGEINIERNKHTWCVIVDQREGTYGYYKDDSLEIAVCKAVIGQYES